MIGRTGRGRRLRPLLSAGLLVLASAPAVRGADRVYWGNGGNHTISYANLDGSGGGGQLNISGATANGPRGVTIDLAAGRIYWANQGNHTISYANLDGSGGGGQLNIAGTTPYKPHGIAVDPRREGSTGPMGDNNSVSYATPRRFGRRPARRHRGDPGPTPTVRRSTRRGGGSIGPTGSPASRSATPTSTDRAAAASSTSPVRPPGGHPRHGDRPPRWEGSTGPTSSRPQNTTTISYANLDGSGGGGEPDISGAPAAPPA